MPADSYCGMNEAMRQKKALYIPQFVAGKITNKQCAALIGISTVSVSRIKKRYLLKGDGAFIHGHTGKPSHNRKFSAKDKNNRVDLYKKYFPYIKENNVELHLKECHSLTMRMSAKYGEWTEKACYNGIIEYILNNLN